MGPCPTIPIADQYDGSDERKKFKSKGARTYHAEVQSLIAAGNSPARQVQAAIGSVLPLPARPRTAASATAPAGKRVGGRRS